MTTLLTISDILNRCTTCISSFKENLKEGFIDFMNNAPAPENTSMSGIDGLLGWSIVIGITAAILLFFISYLLTRIRIGGYFLKCAFIVAWLLSFVVYDIGMSNGMRISLITNAPMAVVHAFASFLFNSDVSEIHDLYHKSWQFMCAFSFSHALSAFVSTLFIIKTFGFNITQRIRLYFTSILGCIKSETFVFWGYDDTTQQMVESIKKHYGKNNDYRIVVVKTAEETEDSGETTIGINKILDILSLRNSELEQLRILGCFMAFSAKESLNAISADADGNTVLNTDILRKRLRLRSLARLLKDSKKGGNIHILFLSDNEKQNLHDASVLLNDSTLRDNSRSKVKGNCRKVIFYCHARFNGVHRVIEDQHCTENFEVRIIDSSHISVELLKTDRNVLPVKFVDIEEDATVSSAFNAMVVGFSEVGQDATRFLYEYGAFVKSGGDGNHPLRSDFHLDVIDNKMKDKAGAFVSNAPAINLSLAYDPEFRNPDALIELHNQDCRSVEFYNMLENKIPTLNYIVVATEDDELNMTLGVRIFRAATRYRKDMRNFCVLIRIHNDSDGHFSKIAGYYNKLWAAQEAVYREVESEMDNENKKKSLKALRDGKYSNKVVLKDDSDINLPLYIFGQDKLIYTYQNIIDNSLLSEAIEFKEEYAKTTDSKYQSPQKDSDKAWYKDIRDRLQTKEEYHPVYGSVMCLRRTQGQDMANSLHKTTKLLLRDKAMTACGIANVDWGKIQRVELQTSYDIEVEKDEERKKIADILNVLAQTEHMRWNASHEILGYVYNTDGKNEVRLMHDCLTDWHNLNDQTQSYDSNVVDLSLNIQIVTANSND